MSKATNLASAISAGGLLEGGLSQAEVTTALGYTPENGANKNQNNGYAGLDGSGKVASAQLPSYVDDVVEVANSAALPGTGETSKIYITLDNNKVYRWSGSVYVEIVATPGNTDSVSEGSTNLYFTNTRARTSLSFLAGTGGYNDTSGVITIPTNTTHLTNGSGYLTSITSGNVTTALGYTPENLANKAAANGYASLDSSGKVPTAQLSGFVDQTKPNIRPTLNLDFANSKIVDSRITFTRTTTASYYDLQGILKYAQPDEPRIDHDPSTGECRGLLIEEQRTNLVNVGDGRYKEIEASEGNDGLTVRDCAAIAPDGTMSAAFVAQDSGTPTYNYLSFTSLSRSGSAPIPINTTFTASIYVKSAGAGYFRMGAPWNSSNYSGVQFNLTTGAVQVSYATTGTGYSLTNPFITPVGNGWYRVGFTGVVTAGASQPTFTPMLNVWNLSYSNNGSTGNGVDGVYVWGAQIELAPFATSKITVANTFTSRASSATYFDSTGILRLAGTNQPRYGYGYDTVSNKWVSQGLVLEEAATNILVNSDLYGNTLDVEAIYTKTNSSSDVIAPNGSSLTTKLVTGTTGNTWYWRIPSAGTFLTNTTYTISVWIRTAAGTTGAWTLQPYPYSASTLCNVTDRWQRFSVTFTTDSSGIQPYVGLVSPQASRTFYVWGWQAETGYVATSYIPTYGATATRAADVSSSAATTRSQDKPSIGSVYMSNILNGLEGTVFSQGRFFGADASYNNPTIYIHDGTSNNYIALFGYANSYGWAQSSSGTQAGISGSATAINTEYRLGFAYKANNFAFVSNGGTVGTDTSGSVPVVNQVAIGYRMENQSVSYNGHIKKITYYPKRLSNTELQALTQ